jgi:TATA-box binding protein (TBP) (component of TFIID and TFIIIB)
VNHIEVVDGLEHDEHESEKFNFVVARFWPGTNSLCCYAYGNQVFYGSQKYADTMLDYVKSVALFGQGDAEFKNYQIVKIPIENVVRDT